MTTATLSYQKVQANIQDKMDSINIPGVNWKIICSVGFCMGLALLVFYVWQISDLTRGSYVLSGYEKQISKLSSENKNLQVSFAESSFLGQALAKIQALNFQKTTSVKYIQIPSASAQVAKIDKSNMR